MKAKLSVSKQEAEFEISSKETKEFLDLIVPKSAKEFGGIIYDQIKLWRFKNQVKILEKASQYIKEQNIEASQVDLKVLVPLIENASLEEDSGLQDKWAAMLANAATGRVLVRPLFPEILKELSNIEVKILDAMFVSIENDQAKTTQQFDKNKIHKAFDIDENELSLAIDNFVRLGLCQPPGNTGISFGKIPVAMHTRELFEFTSLGIQFVKACKFENTKK